MAEWSRKKVNSGNINNGKEYEKDDNVVREQLNAMVNTGLYSQDFAEKLVTNIDTSEVGNVGTPSVSLITGDGATTDKPYKKFKFSNLKGATGATGNGIISISKTGTSKLVDTYTISFTSGATTTFQVTNGKGITKIEKTATSGLVDTYTITFNDTTTNTFQVTNGAKGDKGDKGDTGVTPNITATATTLPAGSSATVTKSGTAENPAFAFGIPKGEKGDKGDKGEKGDRGESVLIYQTTGQNTDGAMSQKATTDEFAKYLPLDEIYSISEAQWQALTDNEPYTYVASVTATYTIGTKTEVGILNNSPALFATYGFVVGTVNNQTVQIFSIDKPTTNISLTIRYRG